MEKILKQDLEDDQEVVELREDQDFETTDEDNFGGSAWCAEVLSRTMAGIESMRDVYRRIRSGIHKNYYRHPWGYQPKNIPPKVAICSSRHKGRKCKKKRK